MQAGSILKTYSEACWTLRDAAGYSTLLHPCDAARAADALEIIQLASQRQVDGFIFTPPVDNATSLFEALADMGIPFVRLTPCDAREHCPVRCRNRPAWHA